MSAHTLVYGAERTHDRRRAAQVQTVARCEVIRLEQDPLRQRAAAIYRERGTYGREEGDFLLCTLPFPVLGRLQC